MKQILLKTIGFIEKQDENIIFCSYCPQTFQSTTNHVNHVMNTDHTSFSKDIRSFYCYTLGLKHIWALLTLAFLGAFILLFLLVFGLNLLRFIIPEVQIQHEIQAIILPVIFGGILGGSVIGSRLYNHVRYPNITEIRIHPVTKGQRLAILFFPFELIAIPFMIWSLNSSGVVQILFLASSLLFLTIGTVGFYGGLTYLLGLISKKFYQLIKNI